MKLPATSMVRVVVLRWAVSGAAFAAPGERNQRGAQTVTEAPVLSPSILPPNLFPPNDVAPFFGPALSPDVVAPALTPLVKPSIVSTLFPALDPDFITNDGWQCAAISSFFSEEVHCNCSRGVGSSFLEGQVDFTCEYQDTVCTQNGAPICGRPSYQASLDFFANNSNASYTPTVCIHNMTRPPQEHHYDDLCVTAEFCSANEICSCNVSYGNQTCRGCLPCQQEQGYNTGVILDCSNINANLTTQGCTGLDLNFNFSDTGGILEEFWPSINAATTNAPVGSPTSPSGSQGTSGGASRNYQWVASIWVGWACFAVAGLSW